MKLIWKYILKITDEQTIKVPYGAKYFMTPLVQDGKPCIWYTFNAENKDNLVEKKIRIVGTGHEYDGFGLERVGSVIIGPMVWHVFSVRACRDE